MSEKKPPVVAITGANGYLGSVIAERLRNGGSEVVELVRNPRKTSSRTFQIDGPMSPDLLRGVDALIHCAYDMSKVNRSDVWRVNVEGTRRLLQRAHDEAIRRVLVLSSMSAFDGTEQIYGQAKLEIESIAKTYGYLAVRPGLVYGPLAGGMAGTLKRLSGMPLVPLIAQDAKQFTVHEDDFADAIFALLNADGVLLVGPIGIANSVPVTFKQILERFARDQNHRLRYVPINWRLFQWCLVIAEKMHLPLPVRSDSMMGLICPAKSVPNIEVLSELGLQLRRFGQAVPDH